MGKWLKGCEICNAGLIVEVDSLVESGISVRKACDLMAEEGERKIGDLVYTSAAIRARYNYIKGLEKRRVVESQPLSSSGKMVHSEPPQENINISDIKPKRTYLSAAHYTESSKASAQAKKARSTSELERAASVIKQAARLLERIVEGDLKDNGSEYEKLSAASIRRHLPGIIISAYQLGIDPEKAVNFYKGEEKGCGPNVVLSRSGAGEIRPQNAEYRA